MLYFLILENLSDIIVFVRNRKHMPIFEYKPQKSFVKHNRSVDAMENHRNSYFFEFINTQSLEWVKKVNEIV